MRKIKPHLLTRTIKCPRCGLRYSRNAASCTHCTGLDDDQMMVLRARQRQRAAGRDSFDKLMIIIVALVIVGLIIYSL